MKIEHVALYVNDLEAAKDFFVRYLDAVPNAGYHNPRTDFRSYFLTFADGARLELMNKPGMPDEPKPAARTGYAHIAFSVGSREKVDALTARLKTASKSSAAPAPPETAIMKAVSLRWKEIRSRSRCNTKRAEPAVKTRRSLLFLLWIYQPGSTTMSAAASEMMRNIFSGPNIAQGPGKITKSPKYTTKILYWLRNDL